MPDKQKEIELRSEEVQEILTAMPHWLIRWGTVMIFVSILLMSVFSYFIKYPDIIPAEITITTQLPPERIVAKKSGKIQQMFVKNKEVVNIDTPLALIENTANYVDVVHLKTLIENVDFQNNDFLFPIKETHFLKLGDIESTYILFEKDYIAYTLNKELAPYNIEAFAQKVENMQQQQRLSLLIEQQKIAEKELSYKKQELERYQKLHSKGIISEQEWETKNVDFLQQEKSYNALLAQISQLHSSINDLEKSKKVTTLNQSKDETTLLRNVISSLNQLKKSIADWEMAYLLRSSIAGNVSFLQIWTENQFVSAGDPVFSIIPNLSSDYVGKIKATPQNAGKIKMGQEVHIRLANYPDKEFGIVRGYISSISMTPDKENNLHIDVTLPNGLTTSYNKHLEFQQEMSGTANIVTEDLRLIERFFYQFKDFFKR